MSFQVISHELGNLNNLTSLVLWANQLEGEIPRVREFDKFNQIRFKKTN